MQIKDELRKKSKLWREGLSEEEKSYLDEQIQKNCVDFILKNQFKTVLCYKSLKSEILTDKIIDCAFENSIELFLPKCINDEEMIFYKVSDLSGLIKGKFSLEEPSEQSEAYSNGKGSVCVIPCLACDERGFRLGWGKGYYDRFLKDYSGTKAILCYSRQMEALLPKDEFDVCADYIITEKGVSESKK